jgi:microsomal dipeptidase-like Zn-dependent dipeptidase
MWRRTTSLILMGVLAGLAGGCQEVARDIERQFLNRIVPVARPSQAVVDAPLVPSDVARDVFATLFVADLHGDTALFKRRFVEGECHPGRPCQGHIDLPRLAAGNAGLQVLTIATRTPPEILGCVAVDEPDLAGLLWLLQGRARSDLEERAEGQIKAIEGWASQANARAAGDPPAPLMRIIFTTDDLGQVVSRWHARRPGQPRLIGVLLGLEGLHGAGPDGGHLVPLIGRGLRMVAPTHRFHNQFGGASEGCGEAPGLSPRGRSLLELAAREGAAIDLAHAAPQVIRDWTATLEQNPRPVVVSHGGICLDPHCTDGRNLNLADVRRIVATDGVIGLGFWPAAACPGNEGACARDRQLLLQGIGESFARLAWFIDRACAEPGFRVRLERDTGRPCSPWDHMAFGSDFDGAVTVPFDVAGRALLLDYLPAPLNPTRASFDLVALRKVAGGNACRVFARTLPGGSAAAATSLCAPVLRGGHAP